MQNYIQVFPGISLFLGISTFILGSIVASFLNVIAKSVPIGKNWYSRRSACPHCQSKLTPRELIPILSFLLQSGRCKSCGVKISSIYFLTEIAGGILFVLPFIFHGFSYSNFIQAWLFFSLLLTVTLTDIYYQLIPNKILIVFGVGLFLTGGNVVSALVGFSFFYGASMLGSFLFKKETIGGGDIKIFLLIGWVLPLQELFFAILIASSIALVYVLSIGKNKAIPFAPFIALGAIIAYLVSS